MTLGGWEEGRGLAQDDVEELSRRFDAIRSAEMMGRPQDWPLDRFLPVIRDSAPHDGPGSIFERGHLLRTEDFTVRPVVHTDGGELRYENFEAITNDGWRVD